LQARLEALGLRVRPLREPGGTEIGEEIRHTLKHSPRAVPMTPEAELLLMNASRAQLVREVIRPALAAGEVVISDRFYDSSVAYQGYGRELPLEQVNAMVDFAVGGTRPDLTFLLHVPLAVSEARREMRRAGGAPVRDRFEESDRAFFLRVEQGFQALARREPGRFRVVDGTLERDRVSGEIWGEVEALLRARQLLPETSR
jgi:dTMP kinase